MFVMICMDIARTITYLPMDAVRICTHVEYYLIFSVRIIVFFIYPHAHLESQNTSKQQPVQLSITLSKIKMC